MSGVRRWALVGLAVAWTVGVSCGALLHLTGPQPFALAAGLGCGGAAVILAMLVSRRPMGAWLVSLMASMGLLAVLLLGVTRFAWSAASSDPRNIARVGFGQTVTAQGIVAGEPDQRGKGAYLTIAIIQTRSGKGAWRPTTGTAQVFALGAPGIFAPDYGDTVECSGKLVAPDHAPPGIDADMGAARVTILARGGGNPLLAALYSLRERLANAIMLALPAPEAALLIGILLGLKTPVLRARLPLFVKTGTIHLVVTSGLKVTLVGDIIAGILRPLGRRFSLPFALTGIAAYVALSGAGPAAIRAGIMGALLVFARAARRDYDVFTALAVAALIMTALTPTVLWDVGFQLSAAGTLGIAILGERFRRPLAGWLGRMRGGSIAADVLASTLAAQIATFPIVAITFGVASLIAPLTNLLLVPLLPLFLILGALVGGLGAIAPAVGLIAGNIAWPLLRLADLVIEWGAIIPGAALAIGALPAWLTPVWVIGVACIPLIWRGAPPTTPTPQRNGMPRMAQAAIALGLVFSLFIATVGVTAAAPRPYLTVRFLDVGPGGPATLIQLASGHTILIDGGADGNALLGALAQALPFWQRSLDLVVLTDVRSGHLRGLQDVIHTYQVTRAADPGALHPASDYVAWYTSLQAARIPLDRLTAGAQVRLDAATHLDVLGPPRQLTDTTAQQDANAMILRLVAPNFTLLLAGDASDTALAPILTTSPDLAADVVQLCQLPNEGILLGAAQADLLAQARPQLAIVAPSARPAPKPGTDAATPTPDDPEAIANMTVIRTAEAGSLTITSDGQGWRLER